MSQHAPQLDDASHSRKTPNWNMLRSGLVTGCGMALLGGGVVAWRHQASERLYQAGLNSISAGDVEVLERAVSSQPANSPRSRLLMAAIDLRNNKPASAMRKLEVAAHHPETALWAQFLAGEALYRMQEYHAAVTTLRAALEQDPENVDGRRWLAAAAFDLGANADAVEQLTKIIQLNPTDSRAYRALGLIYFEAEEYAKAIDPLQSSLSQSREQADMEQILVELATSYLKVHRYHDALESLQGSPPSPELDSLKAESLYGLGRVDEARQLIEHVLEAGPIPRALILSGMMLQDEGHAADAVQRLKRAVALLPEDLEARARLTQAYAQSGDADAARRELAETERIKRIRQEIHEYTLQAANQPESADARYELGLRYQSLGLILPARKWLRAALALNPTHAAARNALSKLSVIPASSRN